MIKYTKHFLKKMEALFEELNYNIRYERGNFNAGYCMVKDTNIIVINKFYDTEGRINCLIDILKDLELSDDQFTDEKIRKLYQSLVTE